MAPMKSFKEFLIEILDSSFVFTGPKASTTFARTTEYNFTTDKGKPGSVYFSSERGGLWEVVFTINDEFSLTNQGEALPIFATVAKIIQSFIKDYRSAIKMLTFSADKTEKSRETLYRNFVKRFAKKSNFTFTEKESQNSIDFVITL